MRMLEVRILTTDTRTLYVTTHGTPLKLMGSHPIQYRWIFNDRLAFLSFQRQWRRRGAGVSHEGTRDTKQALLIKRMGISVVLVFLIFFIICGRVALNPAQSIGMLRTPFLSFVCP